MESEFLEHLLVSRRILVLAGAGLSASSGLTPFRQAGARATWQGVDLVDLATPEAFAVDPQLVWAFYADQRRLALGAQPNAAHRAIAKLTQVWGSAKVLTLTQNSDALSEAAGHPSTALVHMHGELFAVRCTDRMCQYFARNFDPKLGQKSAPECPRCGAYLRPNVVWYGESLPFDAIFQATNAIESNEIDLVLCIGMSADVWPAAGYIEEVLIRGGKVAIFNEEWTTNHQQNAWVFRGKAEHTVPQILAPIIGKLSSSPNQPESSSELSELSDYSEVR